MSRELSYRHWNPTGWRSWLHDDQTVAVMWAVTILRISLQEMETNPPWNWRWTALKTTKMMLVRPLLPISRGLSADCTVSACSPPPQSVKALALWLPVGGAWPLDRCPPPPLIPTLSYQHPKESKLSFPPTWPLYWLLSREQPDPTFGHITLMCVCVCQPLRHVPLFAISWIVATRLICPWNSPDKNTGVGSHSLLQGIFQTQGSNPHLFHLLYWQGDSLQSVPIGF